jgi:type IV secretion system protein VirD4
MKLLSIVLLTAVVLAGLSISTQYVAAELYAERPLGDPWIVIGSTRIYPPWAWLGWSDHYAHDFPTAFRNASGMSTLAALLGVGLVAAAARRRRSSISSVAHGSSRWADTRELRRAGLLRETGVVLGQTADAEYRTTLDSQGQPRIAQRRPGRLIRHSGPEHVLCFAPTRSGKGVGLVVPTLLTWQDSVVVYDIKKENWNLTAGWRRQFSHVWRFEPTAPDSLRFNPLFEIRAGLHEIKDTQNVADILADPSGENENRDHWQTSAHTLLVGAILHVLYAEADKTLAGVAALLSDPSRTQAETLQRMLTTRHTPAGPHSVIAQVAREMLNKSDNERSGVFSTAMACLGLYRDPVVARSTSASDFQIADLVRAARPASLYLVVPPSDLARTRPIIRLVLNQIGRRLTEEMHAAGEKDLRHRLLLLLDEFPSLGRLDFFESALAFMAGYGIKAFLITQSLNQLEKAYGPNNSLLDNCHVRLTYAANDDRTARRISDLLGVATERKMQRTYSGSGLWLTSRSESEQEYARPLLTPAEVNQLPADDAIVLVGGLPPYRARKVRYFLDPRFRGRGGMPPPDRPAEQARELLAAPSNEWVGRVVAPSPPAPPSSSAAPMQSSEGKRDEAPPAPATPQETSPPAPATPEPSPTEREDDAAPSARPAGTTRRGGLPL